MTRLASRLADRMLSMFAPKATAEAGCTFVAAPYCYCSRGLAYRRVCHWCENEDGSADLICSACDPSGTC